MRIDEPTISDLTLMNHDHSSSSKGGSIATTALSDTTRYKYMAFQFGNGGSALVTGLANATAALDGSGTLAAVYLLSSDGTGGSCTVDIYKSNAAIPTTNAASMVRAGGTGTGVFPNIAATGTYSKQTDFSNWSSTSISADDVLTINLSATGTIKFLAVVLVIKVS